MWHFIRHSATRHTLAIFFFFEFVDIDSFSLRSLVVFLAFAEDPLLISWLFPFPTSPALSFLPTLFPFASASSILFEAEDFPHFLNLPTFFSASPSALAFSFRLSFDELFLFVSSSSSPPFIRPNFDTNFFTTSFDFGFMILIEYPVSPGRLVIF